jgi:hypothetical protein
MQRVHLYLPQSLIEELNNRCREIGYDDFKRGEVYHSVTATFPDGVEMDIKCVAPLNPSEETYWCEAVLFVPPHEVACSEISDEFSGEWSIEYEDKLYKVNILPEPSHAI